MSLYRAKEWTGFRENVIELDGHKCTQCGRGRDEVTLQVHHKKYVAGRKPWEYATQDCETLCKGCHAAVHGIIKPQIGWEYVGEDDLEDLSGECQNCGSQIRYVFYIFHPNWGYLEVGTYCCDKLTDTTIASNMMESAKSYQNRKETFLKSKRWKFIEADKIWKIRQTLFDVEISQKNGAYFLKIHDLKSKKEYESLEVAKAKVFDVIESGEIIDYLNKINKPIDKTNLNKKKK